MARNPQTAVASLPSLEADLGMSEGGPDVGLEAASETEAATVLVTVLKTADGNYQVVEGEPSAPADAEAQSATGVTTDTVGAALKAVMDILQADAESEDGLSGQQQFEAGFKGGEAASPPKPDVGRPAAASARVTP